MFLVNSRLGLFTATLSCSTSESLHTTRVPLLPKLRGDFAEFLSESCLAHLSIFYQPTCGGLWYGYLIFSMRRFSWKCGINTFRSVDLPHHASRLIAQADFPTISTYTLKQSLPIDCVPILLRPSATDNDYQVVQEYQPDVHRLRISASA